MNFNKIDTKKKKKPILSPSWMWCTGVAVIQVRRARVKSKSTTAVLNNFRYQLYNIVLERNISYESDFTNICVWKN